MDDLLADFVTEASEHLAALDLALVRLEQSPEDAPTLALIFRLVHSIKGTCGFLGLPRLERLAHATEEVLVRVRDGEMTPTAEVVSAILAALDGIGAILAGIGANGSEPSGNDASVITRLGGLANPEPVVPAIAHAAAVPRETPAHPAGGKTIRVDVAVLEDMMRLVGELVLTRNQLLQLARTSVAVADDTQSFALPLQRLSHITSDLQEGMMKTRMQPIGQAWNALPRMVRDLARDLGKSVELVTRGAETELDRQVLELVKAPLAHMVRNSCDHGIEPIAARRRAGKRDTGVITLTASHEGGHVVIVIADDGQGLQLDRIRAKTVALGLATEAELAAKDQAKLARFIFHPGFSTAETSTAVSGRGVGMDVVKTNIERIGGTIDVSSTPGRGTEFTVKIPLTLAIAAALIVEAQGERFALPQSDVMELVRPGVGEAAAQSRIETIGGAIMLRLRGRLIPLIRLAHVLCLDAPGDAAASEPTVVIAKVGSELVGIIVDRVFDTEEIVVKPVAPILRHLTVFGGNTILGDGSVIMILDLNGVATAAGLGEREAPLQGAASPPIAPPTSQVRLPMLLVRSGRSLLVVPLDLVARLEQVPAARLERADGKLLTQYRGRLMPLASISGELDETRAEQAVLVFTDTEHRTGRDRSAGLIVDKIVDVVEDALSVQLAPTRAGVLGTAMVCGQAVEVIDTAFWLTGAYPDWFRATNTAARAMPRLLVVEDSGFFRQMLVPTLAAEGFEVTGVESAAEALALCDAGITFDVIVSDIEMPGMNGLEFARQAHARAPWADIPMIALSGRVTQSDRAAGLNAGFTDYIEKFHREKLFSSLRRFLASAPGTSPAGAAEAVAA